MRRRTELFASLAATVCLTLAVVGCPSSGPDPAADRTAPSGPAPAAATAPEAARPVGPDSTDPDAGTAAKPRAVLCDPRAEAHGHASAELPGPADLVVGAVRWPGVRAWAGADPTADDGRYKVGAVVRARTRVTVTVAAQARGDVGLTYGQRWGYTPAEAVTFYACTTEDTAYIGGFYVGASAPAGRRCVPLDVAVGGDPPVRVVVSVFAGAC